MGKFEAKSEQGSVAIEMRDDLLMIVLDKPFGREDEREVTREGVRLKSSPFDYEGVSKLIRALSAGQKEAAEAAEILSSGGASATALDLGPLDDALSLVEGVKVDFETTAQTQEVSLKLKLPNGHEFNWTGHGLGDITDPLTKTGPASASSALDAALRAAGGATATAEDAPEELGAERILDNGGATAPQRLAWRMHATSSTDPDSSEQEGIATTVAIATGLIASNAAVSSVNVNIGTFLYNNQNVETVPTTTTTTNTTTPTTTDVGGVLGGAGGATGGATGGGAGGGLLGGLASP